MRQVRHGGGWPAIRYAFRKAKQSGGYFRFFRALQSKNACKTCALGMGGQQGGMVDEAGHFPEICKKSMQAMAADMQGRVTEDFFEQFNFTQLKNMSPYALEHAGRLVAPMYAGPEDDRYHPITWEQALTLAGASLKQTSPDQSFFYVSGRSSNEAGFLLQLFARMYGTNNVNNCSYYCHQASGVGLSASIGTGTATIVLEDVAKCDLFFLIGGNPASNHPRLMRQLMKLRRRGGDVIVINPLKETALVNFSVPSDLRSLFFGSQIASQYVQLHIGGDMALLSGIAKRVDELGIVDQSFLRDHTEESVAFLAFIHALSWDDIERVSGVVKSQIDRVADCYAQAERVIFSWTMGITHHLNGVDNVRAIVNLALLRGMVGREGAGLMPIRGHSNVQGMGSVGVTPALKKVFFERLEKRMDANLPTSRGLDTLSCIDAMREGNMKTAFCLGGNLFGASPDAALVEKAFKSLETVVYFSTTLNTGHTRGRAKHTLILPMLARDEEAQKTSQESMFNFVRISDGGPSRLDGPRSEVETIATIARDVLGDDGPVDWQDMMQHRTIRQAIAAVVPGYQALAAGADASQEFQITGRTFHEPVFATPTGRAIFHVPNWSGRTIKAHQLMLMTIRSEGQFNTVVYEEEDLYRHQERRDVILMSKQDIDRKGLTTNQRVSVTSSVGAMNGIVVREFDIHPGNVAMYFPEANVLVPCDVDPQSRTPAYKAVAVTICVGL